MKDLKIIRKFRGYENSQEPTNIDSLRKGVLIAPSKNMWLSRQGVVHSRQGFEQVGSQLLDNDGNPIPIRFEDTWETNRNVEYSFRAGGSYLQVFAFNDWITIKDDLFSPRVSGTVWWDDEAVLDKYLFVDGDDSIHEWSGGLGKIIEVDAANKKIKIDATEHIPDWADIGFNTLSNGTIVINNIEYTYTPADGSGWLTLTTTPLSSFVGSIGIDKPVSTSNFNYSTRIGDTVTTLNDKNIKNDFGFTMDVIATLYNQIMIGSEGHQRIFISRNNSYKDFSFSNQRLIGEGDSMVLDAPVNNIKAADTEGAWYVSCGTKQWYSIKEERHQISFNAVYHSVKRLKTGAGQGAHNKYSADYIKNSIAFVSKEPTFDTLGRVENINTPQAKPLSHIIANDFKYRDFTDTQVKYHKDMVFITLPKEGIILVRDLEQGIWQTPQTVPANVVSTLNGRIIFHDSSGRSHYLFVGFEDGVVRDGENIISEGSPIQASAYFSFESYMNRALHKNFDKIYVEAYLQNDSDVTAIINLEFGGNSIPKEFPLTTQSEFIETFEDVKVGGIGIDTLGTNPFGTLKGEDSTSENKTIYRYNKIRAFLPYERENFYEMQHIFKSDSFFMLVAFGTNYRVSYDNAKHIDNGVSEAIYVD